ncbi:MAG: membrane integrity-associated transporter subunit PqiC [Alphaproteobacteria bacterium]|nr:membrane integrity-associated transporter subunit PqiC [Alphaproteobacteria bacterium]
MKKLFPVLACICLAALAGCGSITKSKAPPVSVYTLHAEKPEKRASSAAVIVQEPEMPAGFDTARIALHMSGGRRMDFYADAAWPDALNKVMQDFIIQSARFSAVTPDSGVNAPYSLQVKVNDFQPVYADTAQGVAEIRVSLTFRLIDRSSEKLLRDFTLSEKMPA